MADDALEERFKAVLTGAADFVKPHGFTKRSRSFRLERAGNLALIEIQRSQSSTAGAIRFTLNLGVVSGRLLDVELPIAKAGVIDAHLRERIGALLSPPDDRWWIIDENADPDRLLAELEAPLAAAVEYLLNHLGDDQLIRLWEAGSSPGLTEFQRVRNLEALRSGLGPAA